MEKKQTESLKILLLSALAITLFLSIPRLAILFYIKTGRGEISHTVSWWGFMAKSGFGYAVAVLFLWANTRRTPIRTKLGHLRPDLFSHRLVVNLLLFLLVRSSGKWLDLHLPAIAVSEKFHTFLFNISLILEVSLCILVAEIYRLVVTNQMIRLRNEKLQKVNAETMFEVLKNQVDPHFLFNSLNTVNALIDADIEQAKAFLSDLSLVYRYVLKSSGSPVVTLREELEFSNAYANMLLQRHRGSLFVEVKINEESMNRLLPATSLQVLLENAVKHNIVSTKQPLVISIESLQDEISVSHPLQEKKVRPPSTGTGLYNLGKRYAYLSERQVTISRTEKHFIVTLPLLDHHTRIPIAYKNDGTDPAV